MDAFRTQQTLRKAHTTLPQSPSPDYSLASTIRPTTRKARHQHVVGHSLSLSLSLFLSLSVVAEYGKKVLPATMQAAVLAGSGSGSNTSAGSGYVVVASGRARHSGCMKTNGRDEWRSSQWHPMDESISTL